MIPFRSCLGLLVPVVLLLPAPASAASPVTPAASGSSSTGSASTRSTSDMLPQEADEEEAELDEIHGGIGLGLGRGPRYAGSDEASTGFSYGGRVTWRGFSLSSSSITTATARTSENTTRGRETGLTGPLFRRKNFGFGIGFALRRGRKVSDEDRKYGLKDLATTAVMRARARYYFTPDLVLSGAVVFDILGRRGGIEVPVGLSWRKLVGPRMMVATDLSLNFGSGRMMYHDFGIGPQEAAASGLPEYSPKAGLREVAASVTFVHEPDRHWVWLAQIGAAQLVGPAAKSPIVRSKFQPSAQLGVAYRFTF